MGLLEALAGEIQDAQQKMDYAQQRVLIYDAVIKDVETNMPSRDLLYECADHINKVYECFERSPDSAKGLIRQTFDEAEYQEYTHWITVRDKMLSAYDVTQGNYQNALSCRETWQREENNQRNRLFSCKQQYVKEQQRIEAEIKAAQERAAAEKAAAEKAAAEKAAAEKAAAAKSNTKPKQSSKSKK